MQFSWKRFLFNLAAPLAVGGLSALITGNSMGVYKTIQRPPFSPPGIVFPIVWTVLFCLMGISAYLVSSDREHRRARAWKAYILQLAVNFFWPVLFFCRHWYGCAFFWLLFLIGLVIWMIREFMLLNKAAGLLQLPYFIWLLFAGYLNLGVWLLN